MGNCKFFCLFEKSEKSLTRQLRSKYPLAITAKLLDVFGEDLAQGYDIGCKFGTTIRRTPFIGPRARSLNLHSLVGSFHGHAHNRLCQSQFLATYVRGLGLEDLEGCERFFSKSNDLAASTRYSSTFHRRQAIFTFCKHRDSFETYQNLSTFLLNNYKQALEILGTIPTVKQSLHALGVVDYRDGTVEQWLREEGAYLRSLSKEPEEETLEMEYYTTLLTFRDIE